MLGALVPVDGVHRVAVDFGHDRVMLKGLSEVGHVTRLGHLRERQAEQEAFTDLPMQIRPELGRMNAPQRERTAPLLRRHTATVSTSAQSDGDARRDAVFIVLTDERIHIG